MDLQQTTENIGAVLGMITAIALLAGQVFGGPLMYVVEAIKGTGLIKDGYSGIVSLIAGILFGVGVALLTDMWAAEPFNSGSMIVFGVLVGVVVGAGAVKTYKASGDVNTRSAAPTIVQNQPEPGVVLGDFNARKENERYQGQGQVRSGQGEAGRSGSPLAGSQNASGQDRQLRRT